MIASAMRNITLDQVDLHLFDGMLVRVFFIFWVHCSALDSLVAVLSDREHARRPRPLQNQGPATGRFCKLDLNPFVTQVYNGSLDRQLGITARSPSLAAARRIASRCCLNYCCAAICTNLSDLCKEKFCKSPPRNAPKGPSL